MALMKKTCNTQKENYSSFTTRSFRFFMALFAIVITCSAAHAQTWQPLGNPGFSAGVVQYTSIAINSSGTPYVVYQDDTNSKKATVMKYDSTIGSWVTVGNPGFSVGPVYNTSIAIDRNGTPYVVYGDGGNSQYATVMKFDGSSWVTVGTAGFSAGQADFTSIAIDGSGTPYVAYSDWGYNQKATVMKYNGSSWVTVGSPGFSDSIAQYISFAINDSGAPYVVYQDFGYTNAATVMKYNGSSWVTVGSPGFTDSNAYSTSIAINRNGTPYVAYSDGGYYYEATVMKYNGSSWVIVGNRGISFGTAFPISIAIDRHGTPYVAYRGDYPQLQANVNKYDSSSNYWGSSIGTGASLGFSAAQAYYTSFAIDSSGSLYVAYEDWAYGKAATVMEYQNPNAVKNITNTATISLTIFPDPNHGSFTFNISSPTKENATITITNMLGEKVKEVTTTTNTETQIQLDSPPGVYFISAVTMQGKQSGKVMVW